MVYLPVHTFEKVLCSLDREKATGRPCLCIPVMTEFCQYAEHYELTPDEFENLAGDTVALEALAAQCRNRECDHRLMEAPPAERGRPCRLDAWEGRSLITSFPTRDHLHNYRTMYVYEPRFSLCYDLIGETYLLDLQVTLSPHFDGSERYELTAEEFTTVAQDHEALLALVEKCCAGENDPRLLTQLPEKRGDPVYLEWKGFRKRQGLR